MLPRDKLRLTSALWHQVGLGAMGLRYGEGLKGKETGRVGLTITERVLPSLVCKWLKVRGIAVTAV